MSEAKTAEQPVWLKSVLQDVEVRNVDNQVVVEVGLSHSHLVELVLRDVEVNNTGDVVVIGIAASLNATGGQQKIFPDPVIYLKNNL